jgi:hypothetical protein
MEIYVVQLIQSGWIKVGKTFFSGFGTSILKGDH